MVKRSLSRGGFTLVELLVVIAIIGVLIALLLPAVQQAREAARRMQCTNHLKQVGLAFHNYHDTFGTFPSGYLRHQTNTTQANWGWAALVLPFLEQKPLYDTIEVSKKTLYQSMGATADSVVWNALETPIATLRCPSDTAPDSIVASDTTNGRGFTVPNDTLMIPTANYIGNLGVNRIGGVTANTGVTFGNSRVGFRDITDGTSNTLMAGERRYKQRANIVWAGTWLGVSNPNDSGVSHMYHTVATASVKINEPDLTLSRFGFSSQHPGGANFVLCDGAVKFISETVESNSVVSGFTVTGSTLPTAAQYDAMGVFQHLSSRNDGRVLGEY